MANQSNTCPHLNEVIDHHNGDYICSDCGLVLDKIYFSFHNNLYSQDWEQKINIIEEIKDVLERLQVPSSFANMILTNFKIQCPTYDKITELKKRVLMGISIYEVLNENDIPVSIKDIAGVLQVTTEDMFHYQKKPIAINWKEMLSKYCSLLGIAYPHYSVIKRRIKENKILSGHNPITILGGYIYIYVKECKLKISLKQISETLNISGVSIQRYIKFLESNDYSS